MKNKKMFFLLLCILVIGEFVIANSQKVFSHSFMHTRAAYDHRSMLYGLWHAIIYGTHTKELSGFQFIPFYNRSIKTKKTAQYFLPEEKNSLIVSGDAVINNLCKRDIRAEWIGLPSDFNGTMSIDPDQEQFGCSLFWHQHLSRFFDSSFLKDWYVTLHVPFISVENDLNFEQSISANSQRNSQDIFSSFNQSDWHFGKLNSHSMGKTGIGDIVFTIGASLEQDYFQFSYDTIISFPTGSYTNPEFLFAPRTGLNNHIGIGSAIGIQFLLNDCPERFAACFFIDLQSLLLIKNTQRRTFDLKNKPWSRFLPMNKNCPGAENQNIPGVNLLTYKVQVTPYNVVDFSTGFRIKTNNLELELGYNLWAHGTERIKFCHPLSIDFGIAGTDPQTTASSSTISQRIAVLELDEMDNPIIVQNDENFVSITEFDIDLDSGKSAAAFNHKIHMNAGIVKKGRCIDTIMGAGWYVDLPQKNSSLHTWGTWIKLGAVF